MLDEDEKGAQIVSTLGGKQSMTITSMSLRRTMSCNSVMAGSQYLTSLASNCL